MLGLEVHKGFVWPILCELCPARREMQEVVRSGWAGGGRAGGELGSGPCATGHIHEAELAARRSRWPSGGEKGRIARLSSKR